MDMSFPPRKKGVVVDLSALLARTSAQQSASPTARAQTRLDAATAHADPRDPHVSLFAEGQASADFADHAASFAELSGEIFRPRQSS
jgi:hypothetical protein